MGTVIKSQKTQLYWASGPTVATRAVACSNISGLGGAKDQIDTTDLDNEEDKTSVGGLGVRAEVELSHRAA